MPPADLLLQDLAQRLAQKQAELEAARRAYEGRLADLANVQVAVAVDGDGVRRDELDRTRRIVAPAHLHLAVQIKYGDARDAVAEAAWVAAAHLTVAATDSP